MANAGDRSDRVGDERVNVAGNVGASLVREGLGDRVRGRCGPIVAGGHVGHTDLLVSAALTARLDRVGWRARAARGSSG